MRQLVMPTCVLDEHSFDKAGTQAASSPSAALSSLQAHLSACSPDLHVRVLRQEGSHDVASVCISTLDVLSSLPATVARTSAIPSPVRISMHAEKGLCMHVVRSFSRGDTILAETPILMLHSSVETDLSILSTIVDEILPEKLQSGVYGLDASPEPGQDILHSIVQNNSHSVSMIGQPHSALFLQSSRISHSCAPNAVHRFEALTAEYVLIAQRDISPGDEICISYYPLDVLLLPRAGRQAAILRHRRFHCACHVCASSVESSKLDDELRAQLLHGSQMAYEGGDPSLKQVQELLDLHDKAGLETGKASLAMLALDICESQCMSTHDAATWARLAKKEIELRHGPTSQQAAYCQRFLEENQISTS